MPVKNDTLPKFFYIVCRLLIGSVFFISGLHKTLEPYQNFQYVIQGYQIVPIWAEMYIAMILPWIELFVGAFIILGLWLRMSLIAAAIFFATFSITIGQALFRQIPLDECGCFGEWLKVPPPVMLTFDITMFCLSCGLMIFLKQYNILSFDQMFDASPTRNDVIK